MVSKLLKRISGQGLFLFVAAVVPVVVFISITVYDTKRATISNNGPCSSEQYLCPNDSNICIEFHQVCDGIENCPDGQDEDVGLCADGRPSVSTYVSCMRSSDANESESVQDARGEYDLKSLPDYRSKMCSRACTCGRNFSVVCRGKELVDIPRDLPPHVKSLYLGENNISRVRSADFHGLESLRRLTLNHNSIQQVDEGAFKHLKHLQKLSMHNNLLAELLPNMFQCQKLRELDLRFNKIKFLHRESFDSLPLLCSLLLSHNLIGSSSPVSLVLPPHCHYLDLSHNKFKIIQRGTFNRCSTLSTLVVSENPLLYKIEDNAFENCPLLQDLNVGRNNLSSLPFELQLKGMNSSIEFLDLADNPMMSFEEDMISNLVNLNSLNLSGVPIQNLTKNTFRSLLKLSVIELDNFEMCWYVPSVMFCKPTTDGISTIYNLLDISALRVFVWIIAVITCFGNILVMTCRTVFKEEKNVHSLFIKNLAAADFLLGIYLLIIGSHDILYRDRYKLYAVEWMEGWTCQLAGFVGITSMEVSVFILTCMSVECCLTVCFPLKPRIMTVKRATVTLLFMWLAGGTIAGMPILFSSSFGRFYGSNGVCLPLYLHGPFKAGWQYSMFIFNFINIFGMLIIVVSYTIIFYNMRRTRSEVPAVVASVACPRSGSASDDQLVRKMKNMDKRLFVIVLTNVMCWIPISIIKVLAIYSVRFPSALCALLATFVVPINSALDPVIYSITTPSFRRKLKSNCKVCKFREDVRRFGTSLQSQLRSTTRPRYTSRISGATAMSFLGLQDILLLQRYRASSIISSQNRNEEESSVIQPQNDDISNTAPTKERKRPKRGPPLRRVRAFSLTATDIFLTVPKVGWSIVQRRNSLEPGIGCRV